jgi:formate dehydrogenase beta subunit
MRTLTRGAYAVAGSSLELNTGDWRLKRPIHFHRAAPCHGACPAGEDPQAWIAKVAQDDLRGAWEALVSANPLPAITGRVCHHPCESACNRGQFDQPIAIHSIERFLGDRAIGEGWKYPVAAPDHDALEIAVIGAGPAGLSCAYHLLRRGLRVRLFEARSAAGGILRSALPPYRLPRAVLDREVERVLAAGVNFVPNHRLGRDLSLEELRDDFPAVFLAPGTSLARAWNVDGVVPDDLRNGLDLLMEWASVGSIPGFRSVAIIGGGNTAIDLARVLKAAGVAEVHVITFQVLPGPAVPFREALSGTPREIQQALEEGVIIHDRRGVRRLIIRGERVVGVEMVHMKELERAGGRREPVAFEGTESILDVDQVIPAIGQRVNPQGMEALLAHREFIQSDSWGRIEGHQGIFAGGDATGRCGTVSGAVGDGRRAAQAIDGFLRGAVIADGSPPQTINFDQLNLNYFDHAPRADAPIVAAAQRDGETEVEGALTAAHAFDESHRCFSCGECMACDNCWTLCPDNSVLKAKDHCLDGNDYVFDYDHCKGCGLCAHECPAGFIAMIDEP